MTLAWCTLGSAGSIIPIPEACMHDTQDYQASTESRTELLTGFSVSCLGDG